MKFVEPMIFELLVAGLGSVRVGQPFPSETSDKDTPEEREGKTVLAITYEPGVMDGDEVTDAEYHCWTGPPFLDKSQQLKAYCDKAKELNLKLPPEVIQQLAQCEGAIAQLEAVGCHSVKARYVVNTARLVPTDLACDELYNHYASLYGLKDDGEDEDEVVAKPQTKPVQAAANGA